MSRQCSGDYGRYSAGNTIPPVPSHGFSNKLPAYRARLPAYTSSIWLGGPDFPAAAASVMRSALDLRGAVYTERYRLPTGGQAEITSYLHRTRRNLVVTEVVIDCSACTKDTVLTLVAFSGEPPQDVLFETVEAGAVAPVQEGPSSSGPRQLRGWLRAPETNLPSTADLYRTNVSIGYVHDHCPRTLAASAGAVAAVQLLSVLTLSSEGRAAADATDATDADADADVVARALRAYEAAKALAPAALLAEHHAGWSELWEHGGVELVTTDLALQQTTNATFYYLLMSTRDDWLHSTLVPSTIAASAPYPHGYFGTAQQKFFLPAIFLSVVPETDNCAVCN